jgi:hypothetical protein
VRGTDDVCTRFGSQLGVKHGFDLTRSESAMHYRSQKKCSIERLPQEPPIAKQSTIPTRSVSEGQHRKNASILKGFASLPHLSVRRSKVGWSFLTNRSNVDRQECQCDIRYSFRIDQSICPCVSNQTDRTHQIEMETIPIPRSRCGLG